MKAEYKRIYLKKEGGTASAKGSRLSLGGGGGGSGFREERHMMIQAAALVSQSAIRVKKNAPPVTLGKVQPSEEATKRTSWKELCEPRVKSALIVGVGNQILQQFSGINGVLYYTPQILEQAGVGVLIFCIFPTRVRGLCIAICSLVFWFGDITVTYSLPAMLSSIGLAGVFGIYALVCVVAWIFVYLKVPETKGMLLEVISEFFNVGARQAAEYSYYE